MHLLPFVAAFSIVCFVWSYGIQKRRWWAWQMGWGFGMLVAPAIVYLLLMSFLNASTWQQMLVNLLLPAGATCVWIFWARWWNAKRSEFFPEERREEKDVDTDEREE